MDLRPPERWSDVRTGLMLLGGLIPLVAGIFFVDVLRRELLEGPRLVIRADEIRGLAPGDDVWLAGKPAGRVTGVSFAGPEQRDEGRVALRVVLLRDAAPALRRDATVRIGRSSLLAPPVVKLDPGSRQAPPYDFDDTLTVSARPDVETFRALADSGRAAAAELKTALTRLRRTMETGSGTLPRLGRNPALVARLADQQARIAELGEAWGRSSGPGAVLRDTALRASIARLGERIQAIAAGVEADAPARRALSAALDSLGVRAARLGGRLDRSEGTLGRMASDDELRRQAARTRALIDSLRAEARARPLRFLRFRLF